jgi:hypothetical protein
VSVISRIIGEGAENSKLKTQNYGRRPPNRAA